MQNKGRPKLDLVIISTIRPEILGITLSSFKPKLLDEFEVRVIINVDPVGDPRHSQQDIVRLCGEYFDHVISRTPSTPSFSTAVQWCWGQVESEIFLHLEDDWCLRRNVNSLRVMQLFDDVNVVSVRLNLSNNVKFRNDDNHVYCERLSLNPSFLRTSYIKELLTDFDTGKDPEKQFIGKVTTQSFPSPVFLIFGGKSDDALVIDTGKKWRKSFGLFKWDLLSEDVVTWKQSKPSFLATLLLNIKLRLFVAYWRMKYCRKGWPNKKATNKSTLTSKTLQ